MNVNDIPVGKTVFKFKSVATGRPSGLCYVENITQSPRESNVTFVEVETGRFFEMSQATFEHIAIACGREDLKGPLPVRITTMREVFDFLMADGHVMGADRFIRNGHDVRYREDGTVSVEPMESMFGGRTYSVTEVGELFSALAANYGDFIDAKP